MSPDSPKKSDARQRILETADRLFYQEGIRNVGIDRIIAEADVAKMSLYKHFPSKDDLIVEVLKYRDECMVRFFTQAIEKHSQETPNRLLAFFGALKDLLQSPGYRGCPFQNAATELADPNHPGSQFVREQKRRFGLFLRKTITESFGAKAGAMAPMIVLLVEGAVMHALIHNAPEAADTAREAAIKLLADYVTA